MRNHQQEQEPMVSMDTHKNPNLETTHNHHHVLLPSPSSTSQDFNNHHQHSIHISKEIHENEAIKKPNSLSCSCSCSCSSPVTGRGSMPPSPPPPPPPQDFKKDDAHHQHNIHVPNEGHDTIKNPNYEVIEKPNSLSCSWLPAASGEAVMKAPIPPEVAVVEESGRDRLKRHRAEMAGRVWIPDIWGHEDLLKDWIDCTVFDSSLGNNTIMSARAALVQEGRSTVRIQNQC